MENFVFHESFPIDVLGEVLSEWVDDLKDIARLLIATSNRESRSKLLCCLDVRQGIPITFSQFPSNHWDVNQWVLKHGIAVREFSLYCDTRTDDLPFSLFMSLEELNILERLCTSSKVGCFTDDEVLVKFTSSSTQLKRLMIKHYPCDDILLSSEGLKSIGQNLTTLQSLNLRNVRNITDSVFAAIGKGCPFLETLRLRGSSDLTDHGLSHLMQHKSYRILDLDNEFSPSITEEGLIDLFSRGSALEELYLTGELHTDEALVGIATNCPVLRKLTIHIGTIGNDRAGSGYGLACIASSCPLLTHLDLAISASMSEEGLSHIRPTAFASLEVATLMLFIAGGLDRNSTRTGIEHLMRGFTGIKSLHLYTCDEVKLNSDTLNICSQVNELDLSYPSLSDKDLLHVTLPALHTLSLECGENRNPDTGLGDEDMRMLSATAINGFIKAHSHTLTSVSLKYFRNLNDDTMHILATHCTRLKILSLNDVYCASDVGLTIIAMHCTALEVIKLDGARGGGIGGLKDDKTFTGVGLMALSHLARYHRLKCVELDSTYFSSELPALRLAYPLSCSFIDSTVESVEF